MKNVSAEFKEAIKSDTLEIKGKVAFPGLEINDTTLSKIAIDADLVYDEDFEIGTAPMATAEVELVVDTGDEWGRNLLRNSDFSQGINYWTGDRNSQSTANVVDGVLEIVFDKDVSLKRLYYDLLDLSSYGTDITISADIKADTEDVLNLGQLENTKPVNVTTEWKRCIVTLPYETLNNFTFGFYYMGSPSNNKFYIDNVKLEKGTKPTPWTPAPEDYANYDYGNKECSIELGLTLPDETVEYVPQGLYTVEEAKKKNDTVTLRCVDRMYKAEREYISDLVYPTTVLDILESACNQCGIDLATTSFANADYTVPNEPVYEGITCRDIFAQVAELAGGYAVINDQGKLEIRTLGVAPVRAITSDSYFDLKLHETGVGKIDRVIVKVGAEEAEAGTGDNIYTVVDNLFVQDPNNVVGPLHEVLKDVNYTACELSWQGDFSLDLGDKVTVDGQDTYILGRKFTYTGGQLEDVRAPAKSNIEKESTGKKSLTLEMANYKSELRIVKEGLSYNIEKVEEVEGDLGDLADRLEEAEFKIEPGRIVQTVRQSEEYLEDLGEIKDYSDNAVDSLEIGGKNLLKGTSFAGALDTTWWNVRGTTYSLSIDSSETFGGYNSLKIEGVDAGSSGRDVRVLTTMGNIDGTEGYAFRLSFYAKASVPGRLDARWGFTSSDARNRVDLTTDWEHYVIDLHTDNMTSPHNYFYMVYNQAGTVWINRPKLEKGTKATDWTPAPEDTDEAITTINGEVVNLKSRVDTAEQKITPNAIVQTVRSSTAYTNDLNGKVSKNNIISEINQSAEEVQINANRVKIGMGTTFEQGQIYTWEQYAGMTWNQMNS